MNRRMVLIGGLAPWLAGCTQSPDGVVEARVNIGGMNNGRIRCAPSGGRYLCETRSQRDPDFLVSLSMRVPISQSRVEEINTALDGTERVDLIPRLFRDGATLIALECEAPIRGNSLILAYPDRLAKIIAADFSDARYWRRGQGYSEVDVLGLAKSALQAIGIDVDLAIETIAEAAPNWALFVRCAAASPSAQPYSDALLTVQRQSFSSIRIDAAARGDFRGAEATRSILLRCFEEFAVLSQWMSDSIIEHQRTWTEPSL